MQNKLGIRIRRAAIVISVVVSVSGAAAAQDTGSTRQVPLAKARVIDPHLVHGPLAAGPRARTPIIVTLRQASVAPQWNDGASVRQFGQHVGTMVDRVLTRMPAGSIAIRRRFTAHAGFSADVDAAGLSTLLADPDVEAIEPVRIMRPALKEGLPLMNAIHLRTTACPDDQKKETGCYRGRGVSIAIIDTGIDYTHPQLGGGPDFPNAKVIGGFDFATMGPIPFPEPTQGENRNHGTAAAGIAAGDEPPVAGDYIGGVAPDAKLYALKVADAHGAMFSDYVVAAIDWATGYRSTPDNPLLVINMSFSDGEYSSFCDSVQPALARSIDQATAAGISVVASAGNDGLCTAIAAPACITNVISVGATADAVLPNFPNPAAGFGQRLRPCLSTNTCLRPVAAMTGCDAEHPTVIKDAYLEQNIGPRKVTAYSNSAPFLTLLAPSEDAITTDIVGAGGSDPGDYTVRQPFNGTSAAAPYAAGAIAVLQSVALKELGRPLTPGEVRAALTSTGLPVRDDKNGLTKPFIDLQAAIDTLRSRGTVRVGTCGALPGNTAECPVDVRMDAGWDAATLQFRATAIGGTVFPSFLGFTGDGGLPTPVVETQFPTTILVGWVSPLNPRLSGTRVLGNITVSLPAYAQPGQQCEVGLDSLSATRDGVTDVRVKPGSPLCDVPGPGHPDQSHGCVTVTGRRFVVCDVAPAGVDGDGDGKMETAGEFGNGRINNADVVRQFRASLLPQLRPTPTSDLFSAMDAVGFAAPPCGGDGTIVNNDVVTCFRRSFATEPNYERLRDSQGLCVERQTFLSASAAVAQDIGTLTGSARTQRALGTVVGRVAGPVRAGHQVRVPLRLKAAGGVDVATLQFAVTVSARRTATKVADAPSFTPARRQPAPGIALPEGTTLLLGWLTSASGSARGARRIGTVAFRIPDTARIGDEYDVTVAAPSGASQAGQEVALRGRSVPVRVALGR